MTTTPETVNGLTKAAMFLMGIGDQASAELLRQLDPDEIRRLTSEIAGLDAVAPRRMMSVFQEFEGLTGSSRYFAKGGAGYARRLVEQALGAESANRLLESEPAPPQQLRPTSPELRMLESAEPRQLAGFLRDENPQTIALVLSNMTPEGGAALFQSLPDELQAQTASRMAALDRVSPEVFRKITEALGAKLKTLRPVSRSDGMKSLAGLLNRVDPAVAERILTDVEQDNQTAASSVRNLMFTFEDVLGIDKQGMKALAGRIDSKMLTLALKGADAKVRAHFTQVMSQNATEILIEDIEALGAVRIRDVQAAQQQVIAIVRQLQQEGVISVGRGGSEDAYVV
ncbi:MAG TPA: flagellar motor switch protein FliG [Bryobacteraceae bacterium]|nr:flagellar motor switch protein FliG [Bryobacteraceae bacterium]